MAVRKLLRNFGKYISTLHGVVTQKTHVYQQRPANLKPRTFELLPPNVPQLRLFLSLTSKNSFQVICHKTLLPPVFAPSELHYISKQNQKYKNDTLKLHHLSKTAAFKNLLTLHTLGSVE